MKMTKEEDEFRWRGFAHLEARMPPTMTGWTGSKARRAPPRNAQATASRASAMTNPAARPRARNARLPPRTPDRGEP